MSDSGFSGLPPSSRTADAALPQGIAELKAKLIALRGEIKAEAVRQRLEGEILRHNPDGTTVIRTERGEITVALRGRDLPPEGAQVSVEIPAGTAPRTVTIREIPAQGTTATTGQDHPPPAPEQGATQTASSPPPRLRLDAQSAEEIARQRTDAPTAAAPAPATLAPDDLIRLAPLAAERAAEILRVAAETILRTRATPLPAAPQLSAPPSLYRQISAALTLPALSLAALQYDLPQNLPILTQATQAPVTATQLAKLPLAARAPVQQLVQSLLQSAPAGATPPLGIVPPPILLSEDFGRPQIAGTQETVLRGGLLPAAAITSAIEGESLLSSRAGSPPAATVDGALDARIKAIFPPQAALGDPAATSSTAALLAAARQVVTTGADSLPPGNAGNLTAQVAGLTPQNFPLLFLPPAEGQTSRFFTIPLVTTGLPAGTRIELTPLPGAGTAGQGATGGAAAPFIPSAFFSSFSWPAMEELNSALTQAAAQKTLLLNGLAATPSTPARLPAAALFFIAALRTGDITNWLGEKTVDALRRSGKGEILARLGRDSAGLQRTLAEPIAQDWRATALPMMWDGQMHKGMLFFRHDDDETDSANGRRGTRFIFDLTLDRMGAIQLDGLHRPGRLDLILRTIQPVGGNMQQEMRRSYHLALQEAGLAGELSFQGKADRFVTIEMPKTAASFTA